MLTRPAVLFTRGSYLTQVWRGYSLARGDFGSEIHAEEGHQKGHSQCRCRQSLRDNRHSRGPDGSQTSVELAVRLTHCKGAAYLPTTALTPDRYGVTRVYAQQCGYVLTDAEAARNSLRVISRAMKQAELEPEGANKGQSVFPTD